MSTNKEDVLLANEIQFLSYQKKEKRNLGREYQLIMSTLYALKLSTKDNIKDFEMSINNTEYGKFQNIVLKIIFFNNQRRIFVLQLKYKKRAKMLTKYALSSCRRRNNFSIVKYFGKLIHTDKIDDVTFLLLTTNKYRLKDNDKFEILLKTNEKTGSESTISIDVKEIEELNFAHCFMHTKKEEVDEEALKFSNIFQFFPNETNETFKKFCENFYFGSNQITIKTAWLEIDNLLKTLLDQDVSDLFCLFMEEFWSDAFVLTKHDIIAKLVELTLSPWTRSISGEHINERTEKLVIALMKFDVIVVNETAKSAVLDIWPDETNVDNITEIELKYQLTDKQKNKILWYADLVPLVVEMTDENKPLINKVLLLLEKDIEKNKLLCIGDVNSINLSNRLVVQTLFDLAEQPDYKDIINCFNVSLQGRDAISLNKLISLDSGIAQFIDIGMLLQLAQTQTGAIIIEKKEVGFPNPHIYANISTLFLSTEMILESYRLLSADSQLIINCDEEERKALLQHENVLFVNYEEEFDEDTHTGASENFILLSSDAKCTKVVFDRVCQKSKKSNIYFLKIFNENCLSIIFVKGNIDELMQMKCHQQPIQQTEILKHFKNSLNVICAPAGMGKSTLLKALSLLCPSEFWSLHVNLVDHNEFLKTKPEDEEMLQRFLGTEISNSGGLTTRVKESLLKNKKLYIFLDGLDEVEMKCMEHVIGFTKRVSSDFIIWISCRESFYDQIVNQMNVVPMKIQEIERQDQKLFLEYALKTKYLDSETEEIINIVFKSTNAITSRHLLGSPFHLFVIAQNFCTSRDLYESICENNIFLLTTMLKMFLEGYAQLFYTKLGRNVNKFVRKFITDCLIQYEFIASKTYLSEDICTKLNLNQENTDEFLKNIQQEGDRLGIIKNTYYNNKAEFIYPEIGVYLACSLLAKNLDELKMMRVFNENFFQEHQNQTIRPLIDIMFAEKSPLHLAIIYNDIKEIRKHLNQSNEKDKLGRYPQDVALSLGNFEAIQCLFQKVESAKLIQKSVVTKIVEDSYAETSLDYSRKKWKIVDTKTEKEKESAYGHRDDKLYAHVRSEQKKFYKRPGTTNKGLEYEHLNIANFVLKLLSNEDVKDFHISSNDKDFADFNDVVVEVELKYSTRTYAFNLIHSDRAKLSLERIKRQTGSFSISKYFNSWKYLKDPTTKLLLFTNQEFSVNYGEAFQLDDGNFNVELSKCHPNDVSELLENTEHCYRFHIVNSSSTQNFDIIQEYKSFFDNFILCTNQNNLKTLKTKTAMLFQAMFHSKEAEFDGYLKIIYEWSMEEGIKEKLNKEWMQHAIALQLLSSRIKPIAFGPVQEKMKILREAISVFDIAIFEKESYNRLKLLWGDTIYGIKHNIREVNKLRRKYQLGPGHIDDISNADKLMMTKLLWIIGKCPLILTVDQTVYKAIRLCPEKKFVLLGKNGINKYLNKTLSIFQDLSDLTANPIIYENITTNLACSLQEKEELRLNVLIKEYRSFGKMIKTDVLLEMMDGPLNLGGRKEILPDPYIDRVLLKDAIDIKYLENADDDSLIIIYCVTSAEYLKNKLKKCRFVHTDLLISENQTMMLERILSKENIIYFCEDDYKPDYFQKIRDVLKWNKNYHQFRIRSDGNLEWIQSREIDDLEKYRTSEHYFLQEKELWKSLLHNNINLIISDPGMGKTELLRNFTNNCSAKFWTIIISPEDIFAIFQTSRSDHQDANLFEKFILEEKYKHLGSVDNDVLKEVYRAGDIIFLWDALEEISNEYLDRVTNIILHFSMQRFSHILSARTHLKRELEFRFNVLSLDIERLNEEKQLFYFQKRLSFRTNIECIKFLFATIGSDILEFPSEIFLITELCLQNTETYTQMLAKKLSLADLYNYFIETKFDIYFKNNSSIDFDNPKAKMLCESFKSERLRFYEDIALQTLFPKKYFKYFHFDTKEDAQKFEGNNDSIGLFSEITNRLPRFRHSSFAEYFAAVHFTKNLHLEREIGEIIFNKDYANVRLFFDSVLGKNSPPHIAMLHKNYDFLKLCNVNCKDQGGRSVLHLACSWGQSYPHLDVQMVKNTYFINDENDFSFIEEKSEYLNLLTYLTKVCPISEEDTFFKMSPLLYAKRCNCLFAVSKIINAGNLNVLDACDYRECANLLYYSAIFGYEEIVDLFKGKKLPYIISMRSGNTLLHLSISHNNYFSKVLLTDTSKKQIDTRNKVGATPLFSASEEGRERIVELLIRSGADVNIADNDGRTPLYIAVQNGNELIVQFLIESGADVNLADKFGNTPISKASQDNREVIVELLSKSNRMVAAAASIKRKSFFDFSRFFKQT